jgi:hypothetical protein
MFRILRKLTIARNRLVRGGGARGCVGAAAQDPGDPRRIRLEIRLTMIGGGTFSILTPGIY